MKNAFFSYFLFPLTLMSLASCSSCSSSSGEEPDGRSRPSRGCIVAGYSNAGRISSASPADYPYLKYPTRIYCFGISPDAQGVWYVNPERERRRARFARL